MITSTTVSGHSVSGPGVSGPGVSGPGVSGHSVSSSQDSAPFVAGPCLSAKQTLSRIIELGIKTTPYIFVLDEQEEQVWVYEDMITENHFVSLSMVDAKIEFVIERFDEWKLITTILRYGKLIVETFDCIKKVVIEIHEEMEEDVMYQFECRNRVWYAPYGYIPYHRKWNESRIKDFYQLPFMKPQDFLDLEYGMELIFPSHIAVQKYKDPVFLHCQKEPSSLRFRTLPSTSFYSSKRPVNPMTQLRHQQFGTIDITKLSAYVKNSGIPFQVDGRHFIPVVRYSLGMRHGCYFDPVETNSYLGTFYYWEPESGIYLDMGTKFEYYHSKMDCAQKLKSALLNYSTSRIDSDLRNEVVRLYADLTKTANKIFTDMVNIFYKCYEEEAVIFEKQLGYEFADEEELEDVVISDLNRIYNNENPKHIPVDLNYKSLISGCYMKHLFYAAEDELDQPIAKALVFFGYDCVIFGKMAGNYRVVSEVFDVRTRDKSFASLYWSVI